MELVVSWFFLPHEKPQKTQTREKNTQVFGESLLNTPYYRLFIIYMHFKLIEECKHDPLLPWFLDLLSNFSRYIGTHLYVLHKSKKEESAEFSSLQELCSFYIGPCVSILEKYYKITDMKPCLDLHKHNFRDLTLSTPKVLWGGSIAELRTECNNQGLSCRAPDGSYLTKKQILMNLR